MNLWYCHPAAMTRKTYNIFSLHIFSFYKVTPLTDAVRRSTRRQSIKAKYWHARIAEDEISYNCLGLILQTVNSVEKPPFQIFTDIARPIICLLNDMFSHILKLFHSLGRIFILLTSIHDPQRVRAISFSDKENYNEGNSFYLLFIL